jgi:hypothetical protein
MCLASSAALAQPMPPTADPMAALGPVLPPQEIARILRANGLAPSATPVRLGEAYQVRATDRAGRQVRVAIDARYGDILSVRPIVMAPPGAYGPGPYAAGPYAAGPYGPPPGRMPPDYYGGPPPGTAGAYPPAPGVRPTPPADPAARLTLVQPPLPRPKPVAKPAAVKPAAQAPGSTPAEPAPATAPPPAPAPAEAPSAPPAAQPAAPAIPPVAPLE